MSTNCIWEDCDQEAVYCPGHAKEYAAAPAEIARDAARIPREPTALENVAHELMATLGRSDARQSSAGHYAMPGSPEYQRVLNAFAMYDAAIEQERNA